MSNSLRLKLKTEVKSKDGPIIFFIDIDGTLADGTHRERIMEEQGFVIGPYGDPERQYPKGKQAFLEAFAEPSLFCDDKTMVNAVEFLKSIAGKGALQVKVFFITARDSLHHAQTEQDLRKRGLWVSGARLVCKPHNQAPKTIKYKVSTMVNIIAALQPITIVIVDNSQEILDGGKYAIPSSHRFTNCTDALNWWKGYAQY